MEMSRTYQPVSPPVVSELRAIVGEQYVIYNEPERMLDYAHDESPGAPYTHMPEVVVKPDSAAQISAIMRLANRERIPVTPRGAGSGLSGGAVPIFGGILLSLERMNRILEVDTQNLMVAVEPGVVTNDINEAVQKHGLFYAGYPMSVETCFIGGNVAENAGGGRAIKYGVTGRYVLGLEVVLPTGEIVQLGGKCLKDVTGYDLVHLMVGSEGTLGIFTRIILRLLPLPVVRNVLLIPFSSAANAIAAVPRIIAESGVMPAAIEFLDRATVQTTYDFLGEKLPHPRTDALLLMELDGTSNAEVEAQSERVVNLCFDAGALDVLVGDTPSSVKRMWHMRHKVPEALDAITRDQDGEDIVVPPATIPTLLLELERVATRYGVLIPCFGHAGDGNLHTRVIRDPTMSEESWGVTKMTAVADLYETVHRLGGTITAEHGVGIKLAPYLPLVLDPTVITLMRQIKQAFDPLDILNPGKIFPGAEVA